MFTMMTATWWLSKPSRSRASWTRPLPGTASPRPISPPRLAGAEPVAAAQAGHRLAGVVVGYSGAIIPREAMPPLQPVQENP
ncbi:MAG: hypothetical protein WDN49_16785 [Acetobacteraceae bacterium]